jgi:hypothetical protein
MLRRRVRLLTGWAASLAERATASPAERAAASPAERVTVYRPGGPWVKPSWSMSGDAPGTGVEPDPVVTHVLGERPA